MPATFDPSHSATSTTPQCYVGLAQWNHEDWHQHLHAQMGKQGALISYGRCFSSIEGNHTFYGVPTEAQSARWYQETPAHFKFCLKLPKTISHERALLNVNGLRDEFLENLSPLKEKLGVLCLQLPNSFDGTLLPRLAEFVEEFPKAYNLSVEVRHLDYFDKGTYETGFNQLLHAHGANRTLFDTRTLFQSTATDAATLDAKGKKPRVPLHVVATGNAPVVRIITPLNWQQGLAQLSPWFEKLSLWCAQGKTPFVFLHTPNNSEAPLFAQAFCEALEAHSQQTQKPCRVGFAPWQTAHTQAGLF